jgi:hypothetical protein
MSGYIYPDLTTDSSRQPIRLIEILLNGKGSKLDAKESIYTWLPWFPNLDNTQDFQPPRFDDQHIPGVKEEPLTIRLYEVAQLALPDRPEYEAMFYC